MVARHRRIAGEVADIRGVVAGAVDLRRKSLRWSGLERLDDSLVELRGPVGLQGAYLAGEPMAGVHSVTRRRLRVIRAPTPNGRE